MFFIQLRYAYRSQFPQPVGLMTNGIERLLALAEDLKPLLAIYSEFVSLDTSKVSQLFSKWQADVPTLARLGELGLVGIPPPYDLFQG